jgi:hypothetical protein
MLMNDPTKRELSQNTLIETVLLSTPRVFSDILF